MKVKLQNKGFTNTWTQLQSMVEGKSLYNADDFSALTAAQRENYLLTLYQNNDALASRLPELYYNENGTAETRYSLLMETQRMYQHELFLESPDYAIQRQESIDNAFNKTMSTDEDIQNSWVQWLVDNKYSGSYTKFLADYSGENAKTYTDAVAEMIPSEYSLDEESFGKTIEHLDAKMLGAADEYDTASSKMHAAVLDSVEAQITDIAKREAWENASWLEKTFNTIWQVPVLLSAELVEIAEGVGDAVMSVAAVAHDMLGAEKGSAALQDAVEYNWWDAETWLTTAVPNSYLSKYSDVEWVKTAHDIGINIIDMVPLALNIVAPGAGTVIYYGSMAGHTMEAELNAGYSLDQATLYTIGSIAIEYTTEKISGNAIFGPGWFSKLDNVINTNAMTKIVGQALGEGMEEVIAGIGSDMWHGAVTGDITLDTAEGWANIGKSFLSGAVIGGIMAGGALANNAIATAIISKKALNVSLNGKSFSISAGKAAIIQDFVYRTGKRIESGKSVSQKTQERFDALKNIVFSNSEVTSVAFDRYISRGLDVPASVVARAKTDASYEAGSYDTGMLPMIKTELAMQEAEKKAKQAKKDARKNALERLKQKAEGTKAADSTTLLDDTGLNKSDLATALYEGAADSDTIKKLNNDLVTSGVATLGKVYRMFGEDAVVSGTSLFAQYQEKTVDEIIELLNLGKDNAKYTMLKTPESLSKHFDGANFVILKPKAATEVNAKYTALRNTVQMLNKHLSKFGKSTPIKLFLTSEGTVPTSFIVGSEMYINANWLEATSIERVKSIVVSKYTAENARRLISTNDKYGDIDALLRDTVKRIDNPKRSMDMMMQEIAYIMFFQKRNLLLDQLVSFAPNKAKQIVQYFDTLRKTYADINIQHISAEALSAVKASCEEVFETGKEPDFTTGADFSSPESVITEFEEYQNSRFRSFPMKMGSAGIPHDAAKLNAMHSHMKRTFGFNRKFDSRFNWLKVLTDPKNYDGDGYSRLLTALETYRTRPSRSGNVKHMIPQNKPVTELLNYYLDEMCGIMVLRNGIVTSNEFVTNLLNINKLNDLADKLIRLEKSASVEPIGKVEDLLSGLAKRYLAPELQNIPVYVTFDSTDTRTEGSLYGTPGSGMFITINIPALSTKRNEDGSLPAQSIGGKRLVLDSNGDLVKTADGNFEIADNTQEVPKLVLPLIHELGHVLGMGFNFSGSFAETNIALEYGKILASDNSKVTSFAASIKEWLTNPDGTIKPEMRDLAYYINGNMTDTKTADTVITKFISEIENLKASDATKIAKRLQPLATYLYYTGYAHEMYANGLIEAAARTDTIQSKLGSTQLTPDSPKIEYTVLVVEDGPEFLKMLNGRTIIAPTTDSIQAELDKILYSPENAARRVLHDIKTVEDLGNELQVEFASDLVNPDFWNSKLPSSNVTRMTRNQLIHEIEVKYDCTYDSTKQDFSAGYVQKSMRDTAPIYTKNFSVALLKNGSAERTGSTAKYKESDIQAYVTHRTKTETEAERLIIQCNEMVPMSYDRTKGIVTIGSMRVPLTKNAAITLIAGGRVFNSVKAAAAYLNTNPVVAKNATFESMFERMTELADSTGRKLAYPNDVIYMTNDGTIYNMSSKVANMLNWNALATEMGKPEIFGQYMQDESGNYMTDNAENISYELSRLLDSKKVLRLYRQNGTWTAYGTPNKLQDDFIRELKADRASMVSYMSEDSKLEKRLFINSNDNSLTVEVHAAEWTSPGYAQVPWSKNAWYDAVCRIIDKYGFSNLQDFAQLGFSQEFIDKLKSHHGITKQDVLDYMGDGSQTDYSKNILIENYARDKFDWKNNAHIHTIAEAREYFTLASIYCEIMPDGKVYNSPIELRTALESFKSNPANLRIIEASITKAEQHLKNLGGNAYVQILNTDSKSGLLLTKSHFKSIFNFRKATNRETGIEYTDDAGHVMYIGESTQVPKEFDIDQSIDNTLKQFEREIQDAADTADADLRTERLNMLLDKINSPEYSDNPNASTIRALILNKIEGVNFTQLARAELDRANKRIKAYQEMEEGPEKRRQRRLIIREFERLNNMKLDKVDKHGTEFYQKLREIMRPVGAYRVNINEKFSNIFSKAKKQWSMYSVAQQTNITALQNMYDAMKTVDMEYEGWYENLEKLLTLTQNYINGKVQSIQELARTYTEIKDFITKFENDEGFREFIRGREKAKTYAQAKTVRGATMSQTDVERFKNIPDQYKDISTFGKAAQQFYKAFESGNESIDVLAAILSDAETMTSLLREYGQDFIYNLEALYNKLTEPAVGTIVSKAKADMLAKLLAKAGAKSETISSVQDTVNKPTSTEMANAAREWRAENYTTYRQFAAKHALRMREWLADGKPVSDTARYNSLQKMSRIIKDYRWMKNVDKYTFEVDFRKINITPVESEADAEKRKAFEEVKSRYESVESSIARLQKEITSAESNSNIAEVTRLKKLLSDKEQLLVELEPEYLTAKAAYADSEYVAEYDEATKTYKSKLVKRSAKDSQAKQIAGIRTSMVENLIKELRTQGYDFNRNGNVVTVLVGVDAEKKQAAVRSLLRQYLGSNNYGVVAENEKSKVSRWYPMKSLSRGKKYRITTAILNAYYNFMDSPRTDRTVERFENDVMVALSENKINLTVPGDTKKRLVTTQVPQRYITPIENGGESFDEAKINKTLQRVFNGDLLEPSTAAVEAEKALAEFRDSAITEDKELDAIVQDSKTPEELLRQDRIKYERLQAELRGSTTIKESDKMLTFDITQGLYVDKNGNTVSPEDAPLSLVPPSEFYKYLIAEIERGLASGSISINDNGHAVDNVTGKVIMYDYESGETDAPDDSDFENQEPSEDDFEGETPMRSKSQLDDLVLTDDAIITPTEKNKPAKERTPKGTWSERQNDKRYYRIETGLSENTKHMLSYQPRKWEETGKFTSAEFIQDNNEFLNKFLANSKDVGAFLERAESDPVIQLGSPQEYVVLALLNKINNNIALSADIRQRAHNLLVRLSSRAGRTLGMTRAVGATPVEQLGVLCSNYLSLTEDELNFISDAATRERDAIEARDYATANKIVDEILDIIRKHRAELPVSMNVFEAGLTPEQRTTRWHNITERVTTWRYFAMLGAPSTFWIKNETSNIIITGMDKASEWLMSRFMGRDTKLSQDYTFGTADFENRWNSTGTVNDAFVKQFLSGIVNDADLQKINISKLTKYMNGVISRHKNISKNNIDSKQLARAMSDWFTRQHYQYRMDKSADANAREAVKKQLVDSGLLEGLMRDSLSKYDKGYDVKVSGLRKLVLDDGQLQDLSEADAALLADMARKDEPFSGNNFLSEGLNKWYRLIFRTMEKGDKKYIEPKIKKTVEQLVASNMTAQQIEQLKNGDEAALAIFNDFVQYAVDDSMKTYFRGNSDFQKKMMDLFKNHPIAQLIFGTIMPFPRMAINTMNTVLSYSPFGFIKALHTALTSQDAFTKLKISKELGKACVGSTLIAIGAALAAAGVLGLDEDDEYGGVQLIMGDVRVSLNDLMPTAMPLVIGASFTAGATKGIWNGVYNAGDVLLDATLLGEAIEVFGGNKEAPDVIADTFSSFVNQFIPSVFRHAARVIDPKVKKYSSNKGIKIFQRIAASIPGTSLLVPDKIDPYTGDGVYHHTGSSAGWSSILSFINAFAPAKITVNIDSNLEAESKAVGAATTGPAKTYKIDGVEYAIPDNVYRDYQELRAKLYSSYAQPLINSSVYKRLPIEKKRARLKALQNKATREARRRLNIGN